jgi:mannose-6-phosphate isomerase-like protein (cupin superfamily)
VTIGGARASGGDPARRDSWRPSMDSLRFNVRCSLLAAAALVAAGCAAARIGEDSDSGSDSDQGRHEDEEPRKTGPFPSAVITAEQAVVERLAAGELARYLDGASTRCVTDLMTAVATLKPGEQFHPPHVHAEEELLWIVAGEGIWSLAGADFPAKAGDLLVTEPWVEHGLRNSGTTPLTFFVVKWNPAGRAAPEQPTGR